MGKYALAYVNCNNTIECDPLQENGPFARINQITVRAREGPNQVFFKIVFFYTI